MSNEIRTSNQRIFEKLQVEDLEFIERINRRVTGSSAIPFEVPIESVIDIIVRSLKWFWAWYPDATQEKLLLLPYEEIRKRKSTSAALNVDIKLPNGIEAIYDWSVVDQFRLGTNMVSYLTYALLNNYSMNGFMNANTSIGGKGGYGQSQTSMVNIVTALYEVEQYRETFSKGYRCNYNKNTQIFRIATEINSSMVLNCFTRLTPEEMYNDIYFEDYVTACVNEQLGRILTSFNFKLPGDVEMNFDQIKEDGKEAKEKIEEEIKGMNNNDFIQFKSN